MADFSEDLLAGRTLLITGAGRGIGRACAERAVACGARVIAVSRTTADLERLGAACPGRLLAWTEDVLSDALLQRIESLDRLDGLINNAGTNRVGRMVDQADADLDAVIDLNVRSVWRVARSAARVMLRQNSGAIVNVSSQMGHVGSPRRTLYCMSKHAVEGLTKAMAVELATDGIRVNSVAPTFVQTPMTEPMLADPEFASFVMSMIPSRRLATPEDVANACIFLLSDLSAGTTGTSLKVDGGWTAQ